jgi:hypothetical protein
LLFTVIRRYSLSSLQMVVQVLPVLAVTWLCIPAFRPRHAGVGDSLCPTMRLLNFLSRPGFLARHSQHARIVATALHHPS